MRLPLGRFLLPLLFVVPVASIRTPARCTRSVGGLLVAMGLTTSTGIHHRDVWSLDLRRDDATWVQLTLDDPAAAGPALRRSAAGVYDRAGDRLVVAFGRDQTTFTDEVRSFNLRDNTWTRLPS